MYTVTLTTLN